MLKVVNNILEDFTALLFPEYCYACERSLAKGESIICTNCRLKLPYTNLHLQQHKTDNILAHRFYGKVPIKYALAYLYFNRSGRVQKLLHALKYKGIQEIGETLGQWYGIALKENGYATEFDIILPVALHRVKKRKRGFNQAESFAKGLATQLNISWSEKVLIRQVNTTTQTHKSRPERWANVENVFKVQRPDIVKGKRVLVVDDVLTTGATLEACALALLQADCAEVSVAAIAAA